MGVIYSSFELEEGRIPHSSDLQSAGQELLGRMEVIKGVPFAMVHGSTTQKPNCRSDLDFLVLYSTRDPFAQTTEDEIKDNIDEVCEDTGVKVDALIWPSDEPDIARYRRLTEDLLFTKYLNERMQDPRWRVGKPDTVIEEYAQSPLSKEALRYIAIGYANKKHDKFAKAPKTFDELDPLVMSAFQRALELPKALGRKINPLLNVGHANIDVDYREFLHKHERYIEGLEAIDELSTVDTQYSHFLNSLIACRHQLSQQDLAEYTTWLKSRYPRAIQLGSTAVRDITRFICEV